MIKPMFKPMEQTSMKSLVNDCLTMYTVVGMKSPPVLCYTDIYSETPMMVGMSLIWPIIMVVTITHQQYAIQHDRYSE